MDKNKVAELAAACRRAKEAEAPRPDPEPPSERELRRRELQRQHAQATRQALHASQEDQ